MRFCASTLRLARLLSCAALPLFLSQACFYDHRIVQSIQERRQRAKEAEGAKIRSSGSTALPARYVGRIRFYVADDYRKQHREWRRPLEDMVEAANGVLQFGFGVRLEVSELHEWSPTCPASDLNACLDELQKLETADGEWVVGVLGAFPSFTSTFDDLGLAAVPGSHFVMRDVADLAEREAIDRAFSTHTAARREEIYKSRKQHKRLAVFLHEWGHSLGAMHAQASDALLHESYDERMQSFDSANSELISAGLKDRFTPDSHHQALIAALESTPASSFADGKVSQQLDHLRRVAAGDDVVEPEAMASHPFVLAGDEATLLAGVSEPDRASYRASVAQLLADAPADALGTLTPLVERYPSSYAVQHLACGLLLQLGIQGDMQTICSRAQTLRANMGR
jgi:hypothetical protein